MTFEIGQTVVYPHHGAATIEEITTRVIGGVEREYLKLRVAQGDLTIQIPSENVEMVGVRDVVDEAGLEHVFEVLRAKKLQLGMPSERFIQAPPRSDSSSQAQARAQENLEQRAREISDNARQAQDETAEEPEKSGETGEERA